MSANGEKADVCLILEGTYPYVQGGVSSWVHDLIKSQSDLTFHIVSILPDRSKLQKRYELPPNVKSLNHVFIHDLPSGNRYMRGIDRFCRTLEPHLVSFQTGRGSLSTLHKIIELVWPKRKKLGTRLLLNSSASWDLVVRTYNLLFKGHSFIDYFWTWRGMLGGMLSTLLTDLPNASVYHTISTGYAGLMAARAKIETGRPVILTEHGIYSNERRIEIMSATWLSEGIDSGLVVDKTNDDIRDMWLKLFINYGRVCYAAADLITTLYEGNQILQRLDGADNNKLKVIPNGVDYERFSRIERDPTPRRPAFALIGRVVPIKDIKTYIRACDALTQKVPTFDAYIMGPTDEDEDYYNECREMVDYLNLNDFITFTGQVKLDDYLGRVDIIVLTSISEAQPLVILEAGAAGIPSISTDVGACREMIEGGADENPKLGHGGIVTPLSNPFETAAALATLLTNRDKLQSYSIAIRERVRCSFNKVDIDKRYHSLYMKYINFANAEQDAA